MQRLMHRKLMERKMQVMLLLVSAIFLLLICRLFYMQLIQNDKYSTMARENRMRLTTIMAPRGEVFDRYGVKLVGNEPVYTVLLDNLAGDASEVIPRLASIMGISSAEIEQKVAEQKNLYEPVKIATRVSPEIVTKIEEQRLELPGVEISIEPQRQYPNGGILQHVMGYVRQINAEQLAEHQSEGYKMGDQFGQTGLEYTYEKYLRGQDGGRQVEVDSMARPVRDLGVKAPVPGNNLVLTIDYNVQKAAEEALERSSKLALSQGYTEARAGAAVALDVNSGAVLAMASYPTYDPIKLSGVLTQQDYDEIFNSPWRPMLNRALLTYAPGSTFKMIVAMAGLQTGKITPETTISDPGYFYWGRTFNDWKPGGHGMVDLVRAIKVSCNTYFYQLSLRLGIDEIARVAREFGLGVKTGIELPGEESGVVPGPASKIEQRIPYLSEADVKKVREIQQKYNELLNKTTDESKRRALMSQRSAELQAINWELDWHDYDTIITSVGQGDNRYSPLELANYIAALANGGTLYKPYLVQRVVSHDGRMIKENRPVALSQVSISEANMAVVRQGMREVALPPDGTASSFFHSLPPVAAKTGTAEVYGHDSHAIFVAFAPYEKPEIAVAVVIEHAGSGGTIGGPVAEDMLAAYFGLPIPGEKQ